MKIYFPIKRLDTNEEVILVKSIKTGKKYWWNLTKNCFFFGETAFMKILRMTKEDEE